MQLETVVDTRNLNGTVSTSELDGRVVTTRSLAGMAGLVVIDDALSTTSMNPVQNKVITDALEAAKALCAAPYNSSATYAVGDYCIYNNILYCCNTAIATPEAFNGSHWTATTVSGELKTVKSTVSGLWQPPASPVADATYSLVNVVSGGTPSYSWAEAVTYAELLANEWGN